MGICGHTCRAIAGFGEPETVGKNTEKRRNLDGKSQRLCEASIGGIKSYVFVDSRPLLSLLGPLFRRQHTKVIPYC